MICCINCVTLCCVILRKHCVMLCYVAVLCCVVSCRFSLLRIVLRSVASCRVVLFCVASGCVASSFVALRPMLFCVVLRVILFNPPFSLQQNELDSVNSAHSNRHQRYKNLQLEHKIVLEQLKTYENLR